MILLYNRTINIILITLIKYNINYILVMLVSYPILVILITVMTSIPNITITYLLIIQTSATSRLTSLIFRDFHNFTPTTDVVS